MYTVDILEKKNKNCFDQLFWLESFMNDDLVKY